MALNVEMGAHDLGHLLGEGAAGAEVLNLVLQLLDDLLDLVYLLEFGRVPLIYQLVSALAVLRLQRANLVVRL